MAGLLDMYFPAEDPMNPANLLPQGLLGPSVISRMQRHSDDQRARMAAGDYSPSRMDEDAMWLADDVAGGLLGALPGAFVGATKVGKAADTLLPDVRSAAMKKPAFPNESAQEAWELGLEIRKRFGDDAPDYFDLSDDELGRIATWEAGDPVARAFYESARQGAKQPRLARGTRRGDPPEGGVSRNWADNRNELGVSMATAEGTDFQWLPMGGRQEYPEQPLEGWLLDPEKFWGAEGEPLMVAVRKPSK